MSAIDDIEQAISAGLHSANALESWVRSADARDSVRGDIAALQRGQAALTQLRRDLRDGRRHVEPPQDYKRTACYCSEPTCSPPCSWCSEGKEREAEEEFFHPNDGD